MMMNLDRVNTFLFELTVQYCSLNKNENKIYEVCEEGGKEEWEYARVVQK